MSGTPLNWKEFVAKPGETNNFSEPVGLASLTNGKLVQAATEETDGAKKITGQVLNPAGEPDGSPVELSDPAHGDAANAAILPFDGGLLSVYQTQTETQNGIGYQLFDGDLAPLNSGFIVQHPFAGPVPRDPALVLVDDRVGVVFVTDNPDSSNGLHLALFNPQIGFFGDPLLLGTSAPGSIILPPGIIHLSDPDAGTSHVVIPFAEANPGVGNFLNHVVVNADEPSEVGFATTDFSSDNTFGAPDAEVPRFGVPGQSDVWAELRAETTPDGFTRLRLVEMVLGGPGEPPVEGAVQTVDTGEFRDAALHIDRDGILIMWIDDEIGELRGRRYDDAFNPTGPAFSMGEITSSRAPAVENTVDGRVTVSWVDADGNTRVSVFSYEPDLVADVPYGNEAWAVGGTETTTIEGHANVAGGPGDNTIIAPDTGVAKLFGGDGNDTLVPGMGFILGFGGDGNDTLDWSHGNGPGTFDGGEGENRAIFTLNPNPNASFSMQESGGGIFAAPSGGNNLTLLNTQIVEVNAPGPGATFQATSPMEGSGLQRAIFKGSSGNNFFNAEGADIAIQAFGGTGNDTFIGGDFNNDFHGGPGDDTFNAGGGVNSFHGGDGDDTLIWNNGDGSDNSFDGGGGFDGLQVNNGLDTQGGTYFVGQNPLGEGEVVIAAGGFPDLGFTLDNIEHIRLTTGVGDDIVAIAPLNDPLGVDRIEVFASGGNNVINGAGANVPLDLRAGGGGNNTILGGMAGNMIGVTGSGNAIVNAGFGNNEVSLGSGGGQVFWQLDQTQGNLIADGGAGDSMIGITVAPGVEVDLAFSQTGGGAAELDVTLSGESLDDLQLVATLAQFQTIIALLGGGDDRVLFDAVAIFHASLIVGGGDGDDHVEVSGSGLQLVAFGGQGNDVLIGGHGNDVLVGDEFPPGPPGTSGGMTPPSSEMPGDNFLTAQGGANIFIGGAGKDTIVSNAAPAGTGNFMAGGAGDDHYRVAKAEDFVYEHGFANQVAEFALFGGGGVNTIVSAAAFFLDHFSVAAKAEIEAGAATAGGFSTYVGGALGTDIAGNAQNNVLAAVGGDNSFRPGGGLDLLLLDAIGTLGGTRGSNTVVIDPQAAGEVSYATLLGFDVALDRIDISAFGTTREDFFARGFDDGAGNAFFALGDTATDIVYVLGHTLEDLSTIDLIV